MKDILTRKLLLTLTNIFFCLVLATAILWGIRHFMGLNHTLYTNDAQVEEYISPINGRIAGYVKEVRYTDHQPVKMGDTLIILDDREYRIQLEQAEAEYLSAVASRTVALSAVNTVSSNQETNAANIASLEARTWNALRNFERFRHLLQDSAATEQQYEQAQTEYNALAAQTTAMRNQQQTNRLLAKEAMQRTGVNEADIKRAHARLQQALLNLSYTIITAPYDGVTGRRTVQEGQLLQAGQSVLSFVRSGEKWITANYPETEVAQLKLGQKMKVTIDGLPGQTFTGHITAIAQATGNRMSPIPTENASGNFVKVRQRVPVRISFLPDSSTEQALKLVAAGMNAEVKAQN